MENFTIDKIILLAVFFVPGFIILEVYRLLFAESKTDFSKDFYKAVGYSFINGIVLAYPLYLTNRSSFINNYPLGYYSSMICIIIIAPISWVCIFRFLSNKKWFNKSFINPTKSAWDTFFSKKEGYWVIINLKNGNKIGGVYGKKSFSSVFPNPQDLYLEEVWKLDEKNNFIKKKNRSAGILISTNEISTIEFID